MSGRNEHAFTNLLAEGQIGPLTVRNRIVMPAMDQNACTPDGELTEDDLHHYEERAAGGAGLLIVETSAVAYPVGATSRRQPALSEDRCVAGFSELARRVHGHGAKVIVQMCHHGKTASVDVVDERPLLVPSLPLPEIDWAGLAVDLTTDELTKMAGRMGGKGPEFAAATPDDLAWVVDQFADAAGRVQRSGCDGVEIHAAHGYLLSSFLSPHWNRRDDEYGGTAAGRARLLAEVIGAVRAATSDDFAIVVRLDGAEFGIEDGTTPELAAQHAVIAERAGADAIDVSATGAPDSGVAFTDGPLPWKPLQYRELAAAVKGAVRVPVIAVGRIQPGDAERLIAAGTADFVAMGRQLLADPELPNRVRAGTPELIRPCINCFVCVAENFWNGTPRCAVNARLGRRMETELAPAELSRRVVVVGGGPAGMELARLAMSRGHRVTLLERAKHLGGTARFSSLTTPINGQFVGYLEASIRAAGVQIRCGEAATVASVRSLQPDVVVVASGARRRRPDVPGADLDHVLSGDDLRSMLTGDDPAAARKLGFLVGLVLRAGHALGLTENLDRVRSLSRRWLPLDREVVVVGGGLVGVELAEFLAERGRQVTVLEAGSHLATEMAHPLRWRALHEARKLGVEFVTGAELEEITPTDVVYRVDGDQLRTAAGHVIIASGVHPDTSLADELRAAGLQVHVIGDAAAVGYIEGAIHSAYDLAGRL